MLEHDRAIVRLVKGMTLAQLERLDEAHAILSECLSAFRDHNDIKRYVQGGLAEANMLYKSARHAEAARLLEDLLRDSTNAQDLESQARIHNNLGHCATALGDFVSARIHFSEAIARFTDLGFTAEVPRTEYGAGVVLIGRVQVSAGLQRLRQARLAFTAAGMIDEAGLCALRIVEVLIDRAEEEQARALTQDIVV